MARAKTRTAEIDAVRVADELRPSLLRLGRELRREARTAGASTEQIAILVTIKYAPGIGVGELAARERVSKPAMSKLVKRLERDGLVERSPDERDRRRSGLRVTPDGHRLLRRVRSRRTAWLATRLRGLDPADRAALEAAVEPLAHLLREEDGR